MTVTLRTIACAFACGTAAAGCASLVVARDSGLVVTGHVYDDPSQSGRVSLDVEDVLPVQLSVPVRDCDVQVTSGSTSSERVRLSLLEASVPAESRSCTLEVVVSTTTGEAVLDCNRNTPPVSHLGAHRALTTSEAARLYVLASGRVSTRPQSAGSSPHANVDRPTSTITITRGTKRDVLDVSNGAEGLSPSDHQIWRLLRDIADELRGTGRR